MTAWPGAHRGAGWCGGWWLGARRCASPNHGPRPRGAASRAVTLVVVHSISLPPGRYGGDDVERLFTNRLDCDAHPYYERLRGLRVSAHFFVRRGGEVRQFVSARRRAWHAGVSSWRGRPGCNDYSIGIELEGLEGDAFEPAQYRALGRLIGALALRWPLREVVGHEHVAPGRKHDPGPGFAWCGLQRTLRRALRGVAQRARLRVAPGPAAGAPRPRSVAAPAVWPCGLPATAAGRAVHGAAGPDRPHREAGSMPPGAAKRRADRMASASASRRPRHG